MLISVKQTVIPEDLLKDSCKVVFVLSRKPASNNAMSLIGLSYYPESFVGNYIIYSKTLSAGESDYLIFSAYQFPGSGYELTRWEYHYQAGAFIYGYLQIKNK